MGIIRKIKNRVGKVVDHFIEKDKKVQKSRRDRNTKMIEENWGSVENYEELKKAEAKSKKKKK
jgi:hypothetical protein